MRLKIFDDSFKIYSVIFVASIFVAALGVNTYKSARDSMIELSNKNKMSASENILNVFNQWIDERINSLTRASKMIENMSIIQDDFQIGEFVKTFARNSTEFDVIQLLKDGQRLWVNGEEIPISRQKLPREGLIWYIETKEAKAPTINFIHQHKVLAKGTLNFCVPNFYGGEFRAVLCGIVKLEDIFKKINNFNLSPNSYSFIITNSGEILTPMSDKKFKQEIQMAFKELFLNGSEHKTLNLGSNFISLSEIKSLNWFVGVGADDKKETAELLSDMGKNAALLLGGFIALALLANFLHNLMYAKINKRKKEYELILAHKTRMSEIGELISGINHQFIQPVNSLNLIVTTIFMLKKENRLDDKKLESMLLNAKKSLSLLGDTVEIFRNFYKTGENVSEFSVRQSVKNLLTLMHTELSRANVSVNLGEFEDRNVMQIENIFQQILLILLHNAKDAVVDKFKDDIKLRQVSVEVKFDENMCRVDVSEFGSGVSEDMIGRIFNTPKTTKKLGSGLGLYFGKKLANEKIGGDIELISSSEPTIFRFSFETNLRKNND